MGTGKIRTNMQRMHRHHSTKAPQLRLQLSNHQEEEARCHPEEEVVVDRLEEEAGEQQEVACSIQQWR